MTKGGSKQIKSNKHHDENQSNGDFELQNFVDVQVGHMAYTQLKEFQKNKKLSEVKHIVTPGLNDVLSKHEVTHGINTLKDKFKVWLFHCYL